MLWALLLSLGSAVFREVGQDGRLTTTSELNQNETRVRRAGGFDTCTSHTDLSQYTVQDPPQVERAPTVPAALSPDAVVRVAHEVLSVLEFLHKNGYAHGSILPKNILLDCDPAYASPVFGCHARITEFSHLCRASQASASPCGVLVGSHKEVLHENQMTLEQIVYQHPKRGSGNRLSKTHDLWAFGVILHQLIFKDLPQPLKTFAHEYTENKKVVSIMNQLVKQSEFFAERFYLSALAKISSVETDGKPTNVEGALILPATSDDSRAVEFARRVVRINENWPAEWRESPELIEAMRDVFKILLAPSKGGMFTKRENRGAGTAARRLGDHAEAAEEHKLICWTLHCTSITSAVARRTLVESAQCSAVRGPVQLDPTGVAVNPDTERLAAHYAALAKQALADNDAGAEDWRSDWM